MNKIELFAKVGVDYLEKQIGNPSENEGTARFLLDSMSGELVASLCREILSRQNLLQFCRIKIPENLVEGFGLPDEILTREKTTFWRTAPCDNPVLILANTDDEQGQSLKDIIPIGNNEIISDVESWVKNASSDTGLTEDQKNWWGKALRGLQQAKSQSIFSFSTYVLATRKAIIKESLPLAFALGRSLPSLQAPKDTSCFEAISEKLRNRTDKWKRIYVQIFDKRACFLKKLTDKGQFIDQEQLENEWEKLKNEIKSEHIVIFEDFIKVPAQKWNDQVKALAELEWIEDKVESLFKGIKIKEKKRLGQQTIDYYEELPIGNVLTDEELDILIRLDKRKPKEADDIEREFYETHRKVLSGNRRLKAQWDRFVFGAPIESNDFYIGLLKTIGKLFEQAGNATGKRKLVIKVSIQRARGWVKDHSEDSIRFFIFKYRGLPELIGGKVQWDLMRLFQYEDILNEEKGRQSKFKSNKSTSKKANQIKFNIHLYVGPDEYSKQLIWIFDPNSINSEVVNDFQRLFRTPFVIGEVACETVSLKGKIQTIDLSDVGTLEPVYAKTRGSFIPAYKNARDISKEWLNNLESSFKDDFINSEEYECLKNAWEQFTNTYKTAIEQFLSEGVTSKAVLKLEDDYANIIKELHTSAHGDKNRIKLWRPLIELGTVKVDGTSAVIIPPWHPLRMLSIVVKAKQSAGLINHLLNAEVVDFGDTRLFFEDIIHEISSPYYPEVVIGFKGKGSEAELYSTSDSFSDYTLMEPPAKVDSTTNENPEDASKTIKQLVERYLDLQPHERANLSLILYNCNSARLPEATVEELSHISVDEEGARCQIILRHEDRTKLAELYKSLLEGVVNGEDSFLTSESYRDFISRLRIGIQANEDEPQETNNHHTDIVFLQDVISNHSVQRWEETSGSLEDIISHYPSRWSRRKPAYRDDLRSLVYLCCPIQPKVGWLYLSTLHSIKSGKEPDENKHFLPVLEIDFHNNKVKEIFDKVHQLGQWVVNYDSLLDRRQLRNQGVQIIRFKQGRHGRRNLIISSNTPLALLDIMIKRRLSSLMANCSLSDNDIIDIAQRVRKDASEISGDIVLRAAKRGRFVLELIGLVLSKKIIIDEIGNENPIGWYLLDDYSGWFGQKEGRLADIMAMSPSIDEKGDCLLTIIISEVKYIESGSIANESKISRRQLSETIERIQDAIFETPERLDRDLWLSRIADMLIDRIELRPGSKIKISEWRDGLKDGTVKIQLRGYSHIFIHTHQPDKEILSDRVQVPKLTNCWQETFGRKSVQQLVLAYKSNISTCKVRETLDETKPWSESGFVKPQESIKWETNKTSKNIGKVSEVIKKVNPLQNNRHKQQIIVDDTLDNTIEKKTATCENSLEFKWAQNNIRPILGRFSSYISSEENDETWLHETVSRLRSALIGYEMQAKLLDKRLTPNAAIAFFQGSDRLTESQILAKRDRLLTTHALKITNIIPEPGKILISIARPNRQIISLVQLWRNRKLTGGHEKANLKLIIGARESDGETLYLEPSIKDAPHTLIAGTTGSGKSVLLQNLILDIACTNTVKQANIYLIDPKQGADFYVLKDVPHLQHGIIGEQNKAAEILKNVVQEMKRRMKFFSGKAPNLISYNQVVPEEENLPFIWLIHDEFAAWMIDDNYRDLVSNTVQELGMMARAAGIFLIFAAQRPEARMMTAQLRSNLDNRLILRVASEADSEMALGHKGAERLLGKGHLAVRLPSESGVVLAQVPLLSTQDMYELVSNLSIK